jgi:hypothetical protein
MPPFRPWLPSQSIASSCNTINRSAGSSRHPQRYRCFISEFRAAIDADGIAGDPSGIFGCREGDNAGWWRSDPIDSRESEAAVTRRPNMGKWPGLIY